jgi:hypothetical protein
MYKVVKRFYDLKASHAYSVGDTFPHNGVDVDDERIAELASGNNRLGIPLIEEIAEKPKRTRKKKDEE